MNQQFKYLLSARSMAMAFAVMLTWAELAGAAGVIARVDRDQLVEGETVTLVLQTDDPNQSLQADLSGIEEDFVILDQRSESQMSIVNGQQMATIRLMVTLEPRRAGDLVIPPLALEGARTSPIRITVSPAPELAPGELPPVFIELEMDPPDGPYYVHAQLAMTVRIFYQQNLTEAAINPPAPEQASVRLLDEVPYQSTRNNVRYRVLERRYAVFPERSGELVIPPMTLSGRLIERPADRLWQPSVRGRRVRVESDPLTLEVRSKPADYPGEHWLPARRITLSQQITDAEELQVGEPVTRTIILDAVGLEENMLAEPAWPEIPDARIYPDQPQGISRDDGQWVLGHKEFRYAVVPEKAGELVLPEIRLDWWDTASGELRTAVLPEHRVAVAESSLASQHAVSVNGPPLAAENGFSGSDNAAAENLWRNLAMMMGGLWLLTLVLYVRKRPVSNGNAESDAVVSAAEADLLADLKRACKANEAAAARRVLGKWLRHYGPASAAGSIMEFARQTDIASLRSAIYEFDALAFRDGDADAWRGEDLWQAFSEWLVSRDEGQRQQRDELDLYARGRAVAG
ncbi:MAG: BatD family protein [Gammaproteobacteria bacterium]|nr:BatD family protein [Gammaproteobacteria bacterium]